MSISEHTRIHALDNSDQLELTLSNPTDVKRASPLHISHPSCPKENLLILKHTL